MAPPTKTVEPEVKTQTQVTASGIVIPLKGFPGEHVTFIREWCYGDIVEVGKWIAGTEPQINALLERIVDWHITDLGGNVIVFNRTGLTQDQTPLYKLPAAKARAISNAAFEAYSASSRIDPLVS